MEVTPCHPPQRPPHPPPALAARLLSRLEFEQEGRARAYLKINGAWEDHVLTARINPQA